MQLSCFFQGNNNLSLESICAKCCASRRYAFLLYLRLHKNPDLLEESCGSVCEADLLALIKRSSSNSIYQSTIRAIIDVVDESSITDAVFRELLIALQRNDAQGICMALCHKRLSYPQLERLCDLQISHECFYELVCRCYTDPVKGVSSFISSINRFLEGKYWEDYPNMFMELESLTPSCVEKNDLRLKMQSILCNEFPIRPSFALYNGELFVVSRGNSQ